MAPIITGSSPGGCSANALDVTTAERARAPPQPLLMVAKCSVMIGGHQVSSRRLLGRPVPKSDSAGSRRRPQHTRKSRAARAMTPVLQDKPRHSTDLAELCSLILWSTLYTFWARVRAKGARSVEYWWEDPKLHPRTAAPGGCFFVLSHYMNPYNRAHPEVSHRELTLPPNS